jgi:peptidoglycan/LPS O-acetylase OafA/YrhL
MARSKAIDILRAVAVLLVIGRHMDRCPERVSPLLHWLTDKWEIGGWVGVDLFFVLSGFLVSGLLFREYEKFGGISVKHFLIRRGLKIYPAFWVFLLITLSVLILRRDPFKPLAIPCELLFIQNYGAALLVHTWSLAVEEHFYFFLVILIWVLLKIRAERNPLRIIPVIFMVLAIECLVLRLWTAHLSPVYIDKTQHYPTHLRIDSLFCGVMISYFYHCHTSRFMAWAVRWRWWLIPAGLLLLTPAFCFVLKTTPFLYTFGFTLVYVGSACLMIALLTVQIPNRLFARAAAYVGSHSYSIYLWHVPILIWVAPLLSGATKAQRNWPIWFATYVLGSIIFGIIMSAIVEFPVLRLRDRWFPSRARPLSAEGAAAVQRT